MKQVAFHTRTGAGGWKARGLSLGVALLALVLAGSMSGAEGQGLLTDEVFGFAVPLPATFPARVQNGDFLIIGRETSPEVGDGLNETTRWRFDFRGVERPEFLSSARLTLGMTTRGGISTDVITIRDVGSISIFDLPELELEPNMPALVTIELLEFFRAAEIVDALNANNGRLRIVYRDDAIVFFARLTLIEPFRP